MDPWIRVACYECQMRRSGLVKVMVKIILCVFCFMVVGCAQFGVRHASISERIDNLQPIVEELKEESNE